MTPYISVVVCTYNNSRALKDLLAGLSDLIKPRDAEHEFIVVDNNSADDTAQAVRSFEPKFSGKLRYYFEAGQGLSYARNRGLKEARGDHIAFIDDDVLVPKEWLNSIAECLKNHDADCIAGRVLPEWEAELPVWLGEDLYRYFGLVDYGEKPFKITSAEYEIVGANFIVNKGIFGNDGDLFKTGLGRRGDRLFSGEETELFLRMIRDGRNIWYCPACFLRHRVPKNRLSLKYLLRWNYYHGQSEGYLRRNYPGIYALSRNTKSKGKMKKIVACLMDINKGYVRLSMAAFFYLGLISYRE